MRVCSRNSECNADSKDLGNDHLLVWVNRTAFLELQNHLPLVVQVILESSFVGLN